MQYVPKNKVDNDSSTGTKTKEILQEEKKKVVGKKPDPNPQN